MIAYLERYAETFELPLELGSDVRGLRAGTAASRSRSTARRIAADHVVVATGPFQTPFVPELAGDLADGVCPTHSTGYRRPGDVPTGTVLVVGGGNTGFQIAKELAGTPRGRTSPSARARRRCRSASSGAICSGG